MTSIANIERSELGELEQLGFGGEGYVYATGARPDEVYKALLGPAIPSARRRLGELLGELARMPAEDRTFLGSRLMLPTAFVYNNGSFVGYTMRRLPRSFYALHGVKAHATDVESKWDLLMYRTNSGNNPNLVSAASGLDETAVLRVISDLAKTFDTLHRNGIIIGDVSGRNILWQHDEPFQVGLIDCDSMSLAKTGHPSTVAETPDWKAPAGVPPGTIDSDRYKLALAIYRAYFSAKLEAPDASRPPQGMTPLGAKIFEMACGDGSNGWPSAADWLRHIERSARDAERAKLLEGRTIIQLTTPSAPIEPRPTRRPPRDDRPIIKLS